MKLLFRLPGIAWSLIALTAWAAPEEISFHSGPAQVALLELYTSEGCSSCPPAEQWLGGWLRDDGLWRRFVPVAFHVDYWDRLGWRDVLARPAFTARQYAYADAWRAASVYTPCFVRDGAEWRVPKSGALELPPRRSAPGELTLTWQDNATCRIRYVPSAAGTNPPTPLTASVVLLGSGIVSAVRAGENSGRELHHEFVALHLESTPLTRATDGNFSATLTLAIPTDRKLPRFTRRALAGWVVPPGQLTPLQATGGWLP